MSFRRACVAFVAFFFLPLLASAQDTKELPFPFVSELKAEVAGFQIKLSWKDAPEPVAKLVVYRSREEITSRNLSSAQSVGEADPGVQYFIDTPPDGQSYFYAVLARDAGGKMFSTLIPFRNKTLAGVAVLTPATEEQAAARISGIHAVPTPAGDGIEVTFQVSNTTRDLLLFRSTAPVLNAEDLLRSASATQLDAGTTRAVVAVLPGVDYWFAVLDAGLYKVGQLPISPGTNATTDPVQVPMAAGRISLAPPPGPRRMLPLPSLEITYGIQSGSQLPGAQLPGLPPQRSVSPATEKAISVLLAAVPEQQPRQLTRTVLPADSTPSPDSEEALLQAIVNGPFKGADATTSERELVDFLSLKRGGKVEGRAHYYLGQTYYFSNKPRLALMEFLLADDSYYPEVEPWKDACFQELEKENN